MSQDYDIFHDAVEIQYNSKSPEYIKYKKQMLGTLQPTKDDSKCEFYLITNLEQVKFIIENLKSYDYNYNLNNDHIQNIIRQIKNDHEIYFTNPLALVEYTNYKTVDPKNILEMLDGHHRIESLKQILTDMPDIKVEIWIQIYKQIEPKSHDTLKLFKKYNNTKPFPVNRDLAEFKFNLVEKINQQFKNSKNEVFELIRDSNKPRIRKDEFAKALENHIHKQYELTNRDLADVDIDTLVQRFVNYNNTIMSKPVSWFNNKVAEHYNGTYIAHKILEKNKDKYKCLLGYVKMEYLISHCIYI
jgi:hypothetical protein